MPFLLSFLLSLIPFSALAAPALPSSSPKDYPGLPSTPLGPQWQHYYEVTKPLPNVTFSSDSGRSFAGNIPVGRANHPNDTLFFWGMEKSKGSFTKEDSTEPWGIWLNGGPGSSSMVGLLFENGPVKINADYSASENPNSWHHIADYIWLDQPVGVGFSTADAAGYVSDEDQMATDFLGFLANLVKVFPALAKRPLVLSGESYAGMYIPYIMKAYFNSKNPPVTISKIAIGDGSIGTWQGFNLLPALSVLETFPQIIGYDTEVYNHFKSQAHLCGYDLNLTYPSDLSTPLPNLALVEPRDRTLMELLQARLMKSQALTRRSAFSKREDEETTDADREEKRVQWKRDNIVARAASDVSEDLSPWYGCFLFDELLDYALNFTFPWNTTLDMGPFGAFDYYNVPDATGSINAMDGTVFLNDKRTRAALHAPSNKDWAQTFEFTFGENSFTDPSVEPIAFLSDLATNMTAKDVGVVLYSGNNDALIPHRGTEVTIQNTTFGGIRGFTRRPSTPFTDDKGQFAGIVHQERGWTYALFDGAGHLLPQQKPEAVFSFFKEFVFGNNQTGLVTDAKKPAIGGESPEFLSGIIPGQAEIYVGAQATQSTYAAPAATVSAWKAFMAKENAALVATTDESTGAASSTSPASRVTLLLSICIFLFALN
jgi:carboxypeptidase D